MLQAAIRAIEYYLPERVVDNEELLREYPDWSTEKIEQKTGILQRHIAARDECASDLAVGAVRKLFESGVCHPDQIDYLLLCTQSPDYFLPTTACLLQHRLELPKSCGAMDFNLGCSGYIYGLGLAKGLIETGQATNVLLVTAETYSKFIRPDDRSVRTIFGDAAAATLIQAVQSDATFIGPFVFGTDGSGGANLIVREGASRLPRVSLDSLDPSDGEDSRRGLYMNGAEIFSFTINEIPKCVNALLARSNRSIDDIDLFVFHQANRYMLEHLRRKLKISPDRFYVSMANCGNTVSSTIPIALSHAVEDHTLTADKWVMLVGFGVGYSWGATLLRGTTLGGPTKKSDFEVQAAERGCQSKAAQ